MAMQMKKARECRESLEEELVGVHRLETMRRLLNDIEIRANAKVREFKERIEAANEERGRAAEEECFGAAAREELKIKV
jgi:hypothetical protein